MQTKQLLLEILTEEIPSSYVKKALEDFKNIFVSLLIENRLQKDKEAVKLETYATPRRLVLYIDNIYEMQEEKTDAVFGPPLKIAKSEQGDWSGAAIGFAKKNNVALETLVVKPDEKGIEKLFIEISLACKKTEEILPDIIIQALKKISFPKSMRWVPSDSFRFARPIRRILCFLDNMNIKVDMPEVSSGDVTLGHRFMSNNELIKISDADINKYKDIMKQSGVWVDYEERKEFIRNGVIEKAKEIAKDIDETTICDEDLLLEVNFLIECPSFLVGNFDEKFLELPRDVLETAMKHHQRYFSVFDSNGKIYPNFISVLNGAGDIDLIKKGNERVLSARLADARFFWNDDTKTTLASKLDKLRNMVYHKDIGTYYDKTISMLKLADRICDNLNVNVEDRNDIKRAIELSKADLVTDMVYELPELQGKMGGLYARYDGEHEAVAFAIYDQYKAITQNAENDRNKFVADIVKIVDKLDMLIGYFNIGVKVTGSSDPYALRRLALSIIAIIEDSKINLDLNLLLADCNKETACKIIDFFRERLSNYVIDNRAIRYDIVNAVLFAPVEKFNMQDIFLRLHELNDMLTVKDFDKLMLLFGRVINILKQADEKNIDYNFFDENLLEEKEEKQLYEKYLSIKDTYFSHINNGEYKKALLEVIVLKDIIDSFFDNVMVMVEDEKKRSCRLYILSLISAFFKPVADFSRIVVE